MEILILVFLAPLVGLPLAIIFARNKARSIHPGALIIAGLHYLISFALVIFAVATAWPSAASHADPGWLEFIFYTLQPLEFLLSHLAEPTIGYLFPLMVPSSLLYGYVIAGLVRSLPPTRGH